MLASQAENAMEGAKELKNLIENYSDIERSERKARAYAIKKIELKGDEISKKIFERLNKNFRAPIDRSQIQQIAILLDDIIDLINATASRFVILSIERIDENITKLVNLTNSIVHEVNASIADLKKMKNIKEHCKKLCELEREADEIYQSALSDLFHYYKNSIDIIKYKEIYELLESAIDKCKDIANVIEGIAVKRL